MTRFYDNALVDTGLSVLQFALLRNLARQGELPLSRLADLLVMDRTTLYRALAPLERRGLVETRTKDRSRIRIANLTTEGSDALDRATGSWAKAQDTIINTVGPEAWQAIDRGLAELVHITRKARA